MEEAPKTRRYPLLVALAGVILLTAIWATMALAGGSSPAAKPAAKAPAAKTQASKAQRVRRQVRRPRLPVQGPGSVERPLTGGAWLRPGSVLPGQGRADRGRRSAQLPVRGRHVARERLARTGGVVAERVRERRARHLAEDAAARGPAVPVADDVVVRILGHERSRDTAHDHLSRPGRGRLERRRSRRPAGGCAPAAPPRRRRTAPRRARSRRVSSGASSVRAAPGRAAAAASSSRTGSSAPRLQPSRRRSRRAV